MNYTDATKLSHHLYCATRAVDRIVHTDTFHDLWVESEPEQQKEALKLIKQANDDKLRSWINSHPKLILEDRPTKWLHTYAQENSVVNYSRLNRGELIRAIRRTMKS